MRLIITFPDGSVKPAIAADMNGRRVRAFVPGCDDVVAFKLTLGQWFDEDGQAVAIQFGSTDEEFHSLVRHTAEGCDSPSDALQVHLLSLVSSAAAPFERVN